MKAKLSPKLGKPLVTKRGNVTVKIYSRRTAFVEHFDGSADLNGGLVFA